MEINMVEYGALLQKVSDYERRFDDVERRMEKMELSLDKLLMIANRGQGGFWIGVAFLSFICTFCGYFVSFLKG